MNCIQNPPDNIYQSLFDSIKIFKNKKKGGILILAEDNLLPD